MPATARSQVALALTKIAPPGLGLPVGYHSSVLVDGEEFAFSGSGVDRSQGQASHRRYGTETRTIFMGCTDKSKTQFLAALEPHFRPGTYDLLRKNCNSFSDCALFFLLRKRLPKYVGSLEAYCAGVHRNVLMAHVNYTPNLLAEGFSVDSLLSRLDPQPALEEAWSAPGRETGGPTATPAAEMRAARLARLGAAEASAAPTPAPGVARAPGARSMVPDPSPGAAPPPPRGEALQGPADLLDGARLARLQEATAAVASGGASGGAPGIPGGGQPSAAPRAPAAAQGPPQQQQSDEELARALQADEDARARGGGAARARQRQPQLPPGVSVHPNSPLVPMLQAIGLVGGSPQAGPGRPATAAVAVQRPGRGGRGDDGVQQIQEAMQQLNRQLAPQVRQLDSQLRQVNAQMGPHLRQLNAQLQPQMQGIQVQIQRLQAQLQGRTDSGGRGASQRRIHATTTVTTYERSPSSTEGAAGGDGEQCMVCLDNFGAGDQIRILPCLHRFHVSCIDPWLGRNCCCPNCNHRFGPQ